MPLGANAIVLISYRIEYEAQRYLFTQTYRIDATTSTQFPAQDTTDIVNVFAASGTGTVLNALLKCLATNASVRECTAQGIYPIRFVKKSYALNLPGTGVGTTNTGNIAGVLTLTTDLAGRSMVANKHVGPPPTAEVTAGAPTTGYRLDLNSLGQAILDGETFNLTAAAESMTLGPVIFHKATQTATGITDRNASTRIGTMRRRTLRVGE